MLHMVSSLHWRDSGLPCSCIGALDAVAAFVERAYSSSFDDVFLVWLHYAILFRIDISQPLLLGYECNPGFGTG